MIDDVQDVVRAPGSFFEREVEDPSVRGPVVIVGAVALIGAVTGVLVIQLMAGSLPEEARNVLFVMQMVAAVFGLILPFLVWLLYAAAFFGISALLGGQGSFRTVALLTAWGFVPRVIAAAVELVGSLVAATQVQPGELTGPEDFQAFSNALANHPANLAASVIAIGLLFWSAYIWVAAMQEARQLDRRDAVISVAVPIVIAVLLRLFGLLGPIV